MGCDVDDPGRAAGRGRAGARSGAPLRRRQPRDQGAGRRRAGPRAGGPGRRGHGAARRGDGPGVRAGRRHRRRPAKSVCSFFTACYYAADFERAASWADLLRQQGLIGSATRAAPVFLSNHCDSVQATLLVELGRWADAEAVLVRARADVRSGHARAQLASGHRPGGSAHPPGPPGRGRDLAARQGPVACRRCCPRPACTWRAATTSWPGPRRARPARGRGDRLRAVELLTVLVDAELAAGDVEAADEGRRRAGRVAPADRRRRRRCRPGPPRPAPACSWPPATLEARWPSWRRPRSASTPASFRGCTPPCCWIWPALREQAGDRAGRRPRREGRRGRAGDARRGAGAGRPRAARSNGRRAAGTPRTGAAAGPPC